MAKPREPCVIAGPSCNSVDVLYEKEPYLLPDQPRDRGESADRRNGRLYDDLFLRRLQRLPAAQILCDLSGGAEILAAEKRSAALTPILSRTAGGGSTIEPGRCEGRLAHPGMAGGGSDDLDFEQSRAMRLHSLALSPHRMFLSPTSSRPISRPAKLCSMRLSARRVSIRPWSGCARAACPRRVSHLLQRTRANSSAPCGCGISSRRCATALLLGPLAVAKAYRSRGLGRGSWGKLCSVPWPLGHGAVLLVGDAPYYERFRLLPGARRSGSRLPGPVDEARFLGLELAARRSAGREGRGATRLAPRSPSASRECSNRVRAVLDRHRQKSHLSPHSRTAQGAAGLKLAAACLVPLRAAEMRPRIPLDPVRR